MPPGLTAPPPLCQVSEWPVLVVQPAGGLHFPAVEALREAVTSRALGGTWAGQEWLHVASELPVSPSHPACSLGPRACPRSGRRSGRLSGLAPH